MELGQTTDPEIAIIFKMFQLCETFGWTLNDLDVPRSEQKKITDMFIKIITKRNEQAESERRRSEAQARLGRMR